MREVHVDGVNAEVSARYLHRIDGSSGAVELQVVGDGDGLFPVQNHLHFT